MTEKGTHTDLEYLAWTVARFGADLDRWPDEDRRALKHLIDSSPEASRMLEEARAVDRLLDMMRTAVNVAGDSMVTSVIANSEGMMDKEQFRDLSDLDEYAENNQQEATG